MKTVSVPISEARSELCALVKQVQAGVRVTLTSHGRPAAQLLSVPAPPVPWRVEPPNDPERYDLQSPVREPEAPSSQRGSQKNYAGGPNDMLRRSFGSMWSGQRRAKRCGFLANNCSAPAHRWRPMRGKLRKRTPSPSSAQNWTGGSGRPMNPSFGSSCSRKIVEFGMKRMTGCTRKRVNFWQFSPPWCPNCASVVIDRVPSACFQHVSICLCQRFSISVFGFLFFDPCSSSASTTC